MKFGKGQAYSSDDFESDEGGFDLFKNNTINNTNGNISRVSVKRDILNDLDADFHNINFDTSNRNNSVSNNNRNFLNLKNFFPKNVRSSNENSNKFKSYLIGNSASYAKCATAENLYDLTISENQNEPNTTTKQSKLNAQTINSQSYNDFNSNNINESKGKLMTRSKNVQSDDSLDFKEENLKCQEEINYTFNKTVSKIIYIFRCFFFVVFLKLLINNLSIKLRLKTSPLNFHACSSLISGIHA